MAAKDWLSPPKSLWDTDRHVRGRRRMIGAGFSDADEEHAVHEGLRLAHKQVWVDLWARVTTAEARVVELEEANRILSGRKRTTHCPQGHELTADNVYVSNDKRTCKTCQKARQKTRYEQGKS